jgi:hypothetical protein
VWKHRLSNKNLQNKTAFCSNCGFVKIKRITDTNYRCYKAIYEYRRINGNRVKYHKKPNPGICDICSNTIRIAYDHDHITGKFRGWLCINCNTTLGLVHDDPEHLQKLLNYLRVTRELV